MILLSNIHPLTDFKRNTTEFRNRLKRSGLPALLTVEGRPDLVVQDAAAYQKLLDLLDRADASEGVRKGLDSKKAGEGKDAAAFFADARRKLGLPPRKR